MEKILSCKDFFKSTLKLLSDKARENEYIGKELVMIPRLMESGREYAMQWLKDMTFKDTFKGNNTAYYLALCANCIGGGMMYADAWADSESRFSELKYDALYDGSVWENIFSLAEVTTDGAKTELRKFIMVLFEAWVKSVYEYLSLDNAGDYLIESFNAFFQLGAGMRLCIIGY